MDKEEVQKRVLQNGKPLALSKFTWDDKTNTFSSLENNLVLDFTAISDCTFKTSSNCTFKTDSNCTFDTGYNCTFKTGSDCTFNTSSNCTFKTDSNCTFNTGYNCTFKTSSNCTFKTDSNCTFDTGSNCTFDTDSNCTFKTGYNCTFDTGSNCTFDTGSNCTFDTGSYCVIVGRNIFAVIQPKENEIIHLCPYGIEGYLINGIHSITGKKCIIADNILSEIINQKGNIYKIKNHGQNDITFLIKQGDVYSHGKTLKEAHESLIYKISDRDTSKYQGFSLDTVLTKTEAIQMYRCITGACEEGTKYFVERLENCPEKATIKEIIEITKGQYSSNLLQNFFKGE